MLLSPVNLPSSRLGSYCKKSFLRSSGYVIHETPIKPFPPQMHASYLHRCHTSDNAIGCRNTPVVDMLPVGDGKAGQTSPGRAGAGREDDLSRSFAGVFSGHLSSM